MVLNGFIPWRVSPLLGIINSIIEGARCVFKNDFRFDEVSIIRGYYIFFHEGFMIIKVLKSKNDQLCKDDDSK